MKIFIYNRLLKEDEQALKTCLKHNLEYQGIIFTEIELNKQYNNSPICEKTLQIAGGEQMKLQGITITKNKTCNTWYARYRKDGKQFYVSAKTQLECYNKLKIALKIKERNKKSKKENQYTLIAWYKKWLNLYKQNVKQNTITDYEHSLKYLKKYFETPINEIKSINILEELNKIPFQRRKQKTYELLNDLLKKAVINEIINKNPIEIIEKPKHKKINGSALTNKDETILENILISKQLDMYLICLYQGLRRGEALALTIKDLNFEEQTIRINKAINSKNEFDTTKNVYSERTIPMFDKTKEILKKYKNKKERLFEWTYKQSEKPFEKIIKEIFPNKKYTIHSLRHTFITRCQELNIPLHIIQKWVGHNIGSKVTSSVYTHSRELAEVENIKLYNQKFNSNSTHF